MAVVDGVFDELSPQNLTLKADRHHEVLREAERQIGNGGSRSVASSQVWPAYQLKW
jgi:hypothetical protein